MSAQLDLFAWADARPSNIVDAMPALIRKAAAESDTRTALARPPGIVLELRRTA